MQIDAQRGGAIEVRVGSAFRDLDVVRIRDALAALGPFSRLTIDFGATRQCDDAALVELARMLRVLSRGEVSLNGLTLHQSRLLDHVGLRSTRRFSTESQSTGEAGGGPTA
jgi:hypothetical protein